MNQYTPDKNTHLSADELTTIKNDYLFPTNKKEENNTAEKQEPTGLMDMLLYGSGGKRVVAFLTISIMITCGMTNAGIILLQISGVDDIQDLNWEKDNTWIGMVFATFGGVFSGYAQKGIYLESLDGLDNMWQEGILKNLNADQRKIHALVLLCAVCSFLVNFGLGMLGMGVLIAAVGSGLLIPLALLFALANAALVYYTALCEIKKNRSLADCFKKSTFLGLFFTFIAACGLVMIFYPGAMELIGKYFKETAGKVIFCFMLFFALLTEAFYSFTKACHLATMFAVKKFPSFWNSMSILINSVINSAIGMEGGIESAPEFGVEEKNSTGNICMQTFGGVTAAGWSTTCSAPIPEKKNVFHLWKSAQSEKPKNPSADEDGVWNTINPKFA